MDVGKLCNLLLSHVNHKQQPANTTLHVAVSCRYLIALVAVAVVLYCGALSALGVLFGYFTGCVENEVGLSLRACV